MLKAASPYWHWNNRLLFLIVFAAGAIALSLIFFAYGGLSHFTTTTAHSYAPPLSAPPRNMADYQAFVDKFKDPSMLSFFGA